MLSFSPDPEGPDHIWRINQESRQLQTLTTNLHAVNPKLHGNQRRSAVNPVRAAGRRQQLLFLGMKPTERFVKPASKPPLLEEDVFGISYFSVSD